MPGEWRTPISLAYVWDSRCRNSTPCEQRAYLRESSGGRARHGTLGGPAQQGRHDGHFNSARASYNGGDWPSLCENARAPFSGVHFSHVDAISGDFSRRIRPLAILRGERKVFSHNLGRLRTPTPSAESHLQIGVKSCPRYGTFRHGRVASNDRTLPPLPTCSCLVYALMAPSVTE